MMFGCCNQKASESQCDKRILWINTICIIVCGGMEGFLSFNHEAGGFLTQTLVEVQ